MPFVFRLAVPLRLARANRDGQRRELAIAMRELLAAEQALRVAEENFERIGTELLARARGGIDGVEIAELSDARDRARVRLPALRVRVRETAAREEEIRRALAQSSREVTVLEKLRREAHREYVRGLQRREQKMIDDVVLVRRVRELAAARVRDAAEFEP